MTKSEIAISYVRIVMAKENVSQTELANQIGITPPSMHDFFQQKNISLNRLDSIFDALGYELKFNLVKKDLSDPAGLPHECPYAPAGILHIE